MPRTFKRGGERTGTPGTTYTNRTDLNQPVTVAPAAHYGDATQQAQSQQAVPLPDNAGQLAQLAQAAGQAGQSSPTAGPTQPVQPGPRPGELGDFHRPSEWPHVPVTDGAPLGAGAGPEALIGGPTPNIAQTIAQVAEMSGNQSLMALAQRARGGG